MLSSDQLMSHDAAGPQWPAVVGDPLGITHVHGEDPRGSV